MNKKLRAFHNDPKIKEKYIERVRNHQMCDEIEKGHYWEGGKGCAVGCTIEGSNHDRYETELGIPTIIAYLEDGLFENMSNKDAMEFPLRFLESIPVGADLSMVFTKLTIWEWEDEKYGLKNIPEISKDKELVDCCEKVVSVYKRHLAGETIGDNEWYSLEELTDKIYSARARAGAWAWAGARAGARAGAWAWARAWAGAWAWARAWAGAWAWAWAGAGADFEKQIKITADKLLETMSSSPIE